MIKAVQPYIYSEQLNFKDKPFEAWKKTLSDSPCTGRGSFNGFYPRLLHKLMFEWDMPTLWRGEARLCFVQPVSLYFDTFFAGINHEIIPFIWDCWPCYYNKMEKWLKRHKIKTAIFTSSMEMEEMKRRVPEISYLYCPEAVDTSVYKEGTLLKDRSIDLLEFGRGVETITKTKTETETITKTKTETKTITKTEKGDLSFDSINHVKTLVDGKFLYTEEQLYDAMADAKITICLPRSITHPQIAEGVETLTQRYWEAMLSRMVIVGHCPKELEELVGYNPIVEMVNGEGLEVREQILDIINNISDYQGLVDKNRETALRMGDWKTRMTLVRNWLVDIGYGL